MTLITLIAKITADERTEEILFDAMRSATKVYNGLIWQLREQYEQTGKAPISRKNLNKLMKLLPRAGEYYSLSTEATRDEVIGAYRSFFTLRKEDERARPPGFRRKGRLSNLRYYDGYGFSLTEEGRLQLSLGRRRLDGVRSVEVDLQIYRTDVKFNRIVNVLITYDAKHGLQAHLVVDAKDRKALGERTAAVDLGETQMITAVFDDGKALLYSGRLIKAIRRYWQKVRRCVKPPAAGQRKSRRYREIDRQESRQVRQLLHLITTDFVERCYRAGVSTIVLGDVKGIRRRMQYGKQANQRLHVWSFSKISEMIIYKASMRGIEVVKVSEAHTSQQCHQCGKVSRANRRQRGEYACACGWQTHADVNAAANLYERYAHVSPLKRSSGRVASPVVVPLRCSWHTVYEPGCP
jgi:IS605 OrfB family transposase